MGSALFFIAVFLFLEGIVRENILRNLMQLALHLNHCTNLLDVEDPIMKDPGFRHQIV